MVDLSIPSSPTYSLGSGTPNTSVDASLLAPFTPGATIPGNPVSILNPTVTPLAMSNQPVPPTGTTPAPTLVFPTALTSQPPSPANIGTQNTTGASTSSYPFILFSLIQYRDPYSIQEMPVSSAKIGPTQAAQSFAFQTIALPLPQTLESLTAPQWDMPDSKIVSAGFDVVRGQMGWDMAGNDLLALLAPTFTQKIGFNAANPKKAAFFAGIDPREFSFSWILTPQSLAEAQTIYQIVYAFTQNSLPSFSATSANSAFLGFPCEYKIQFNGVIGFPKFTQSLVCTGVGTSFTPTNGLEIGADGYAVSTQLTLTFKETTIRTYQDPGI